MAYATVAQLRQYLEQVPAGAEYDAQLQSVLDRAHEIVTEALGFEFGDWATEATACDVRGQGSEWLFVPAHQPSTVAAVAEVSDRGAATETTEAVADYLEEADGRLYRAAGWVEGTWYRVTAIWGYGPASASVVEVELQVAANLRRNRDIGSLGTVSGVEGQGSVETNRALNWAQRSILDGIRGRYEGVVHA